MGYYFKCHKKTEFSKENAVFLFKDYIQHLNIQPVILLHPSFQQPYVCSYADAT